MNEYNYIIMGAGSAGAALAARLSEDPHCRVLMLEAGPDDCASHAPPEMLSPNFWGIVQNERFFWPTLKARIQRSGA